MEGVRVIEVAAWTFVPAAGAVLADWGADVNDYIRSQPIAFDDIAGGQTIAVGIAAALFERANTGKTSVVDLSLLSYGLWSASPHIVLSRMRRPNSASSATQSSLCWARALASANLPSLQGADGSDFELVANPEQFDEARPDLVRAPETGEHTEEILLEPGLTWEDLANLKAEAVIT